MSNVRSQHLQTVLSFDGIRAVSTLILLLPHSGFSATVPANGYLITTLTLEGSGRTGEIDILNFYALFIAAGLGRALCACAYQLCNSGDYGRLLTPADFGVAVLGCD